MVKNKTKSNIVTAKEIEAHFKAIKEFQPKMKKRINYIVKEICKVYKAKLDYWEYQNADEDDAGEGSFDYDTRNNVVAIWINAEHKKYDYLDLIDSKGNIICLNDGFPVEWLYSDDFKKELKDGHDRSFKNSQDQLLEQEEKDLEEFNRLKKKLKK